MISKTIVPWISRRFIMFILVGIVNTLFSYTLYALFLFSGLHYWIATTLSTIISILFNFKTTGRLVFGNRDSRLIFRFFGVYGINYVFGIIGLWCFNACGVNMYLAGILMLPPAAVFSYILNKKFVFYQRLKTMESYSHPAENQLDCNNP